MFAKHRYFVDILLVINQSLKILNKDKEEKIY